MLEEEIAAQRRNTRSTRSRRSGRGRGRGRGRGGGGGRGRGRAKQVTNNKKSSGTYQFQSHLTQKFSKN